MENTENYPRPLSTLAREVQKDYASRGKPVYFAAVPYVKAMSALHDMNDSYGFDSASSVVAYALSNLATWRGPVAVQVKRELKIHQHLHDPKRYKMPK